MRWYWKPMCQFFGPLISKEALCYWEALGFTAGDCVSDILDQTIINTFFCKINFQTLIITQLVYQKTNIKIIFFQLYCILISNTIRDITKTTYGKNLPRTPFVLFVIYVHRKDKVDEVLHFRIGTFKLKSFLQELCIH